MPAADELVELLVEPMDEDEPSTYVCCCGCCAPLPFAVAAPFTRVALAGTYVSEPF